MELWCFFVVSLNKLFNKLINGRWKGFLDSHVMSHWCLLDHHYNDVIMGTMVSQISSLTMFTQPFIRVQRKHQSSASLAFVRGIHRSPVTRKVFPFDDVIMIISICFVLVNLLLPSGRMMRIWLWSPLVHTMASGSMESLPESMLTVKNKSCHYANFVVTGSIEVCQS